MKYRSLVPLSATPPTLGQGVLVRHTNSQNDYGIGMVVGLSRQRAIMNDHNVDPVVWSVYWPYINATYQHDTAHLIVVASDTSITLTQE